MFSAFKKAGYSLGIEEKDGKESSKTIDGISVCSNKTCILNLAKQSQKPRNCLPSLAIGISGVSRPIDSRIMDFFNPSL
ncbi:hypothetical protein EDC96DRAFT_511635 [Choanephora cucurbitarum]|nr:hypothetical protein EDC96DRAFT_511635 [Choanephora cucurbitarum]